MFFFFLFFLVLPLAGQEQPFVEAEACDAIYEFSEVEEGESTLLEDLLIVNYWNRRMNERFPVTYNHLLQGGYFNMPSARMGIEGEMGVGYAYVPPYINYNLRIQLADFLEITGNYRIFKGVEDPVLTRHGFGDYSDKGANVKLSLFSAEDSRYRLPGLAVGMEDFLGTQSFKAYYIVATQVFLAQNIEVSLGFGANRMRKWFGGMTWMPFRHSVSEWLKGIAVVCEYDAIPYGNKSIEKHPKGRVKRTPWHCGIKYRAWDSFDFSLSYIRGDKWAFTISTFYNFGSTKGLIPKVEDTLPYQAPLDFQPLGEWRPPDVMTHELLYAFRGQGFEISEAWLGDDDGQRVLRLHLANMAYRAEYLVRLRLNALLSSLLPQDIDRVIVLLEVGSTPIQEWHYEASYLRLFKERTVGSYSLNILSPLKEASHPNPYCSRLLFKEDLERWNIELLPKTRTLFGSAKGKFKYELGLSANLNGFLFNKIFYTLSLGYYFFSDLEHTHDVDILNPSQLLNVRTDIVRYDKVKTLTVDQAYLEQVWNWGRGLYGRIAVGIFEVQYGGAAFEWLYYPVHSDWAIGMEAALVKKRTPHGVDFTNRVRQLHGFKPHYVKFVGLQYFLNLYYDWRCVGLDFRVNIGQFLARDIGARTEVSRYFPSGLRIGCWYTYTNARDIINRQNYHDKGLFFSVPLDIFYTKTSRSRWGYGMSAWLRDVGATASTGGSLYDRINQERQ